MNNLVKVENNQVVVSSRDIAANFEKRHDNVLKDIDELIKGSPQKLGDLFNEVEYTHPQNYQVYREILMNRDGFTLLAMGFTGQKALEWKLKYMREVISLDTTSWRKDTASLINKMAMTLGGNENIKTLREESYKLLDSRMGVSLSTRLTNKRRRMADEGVCKSSRDKLNNLDVIAEDKKLIEGYVAIVKEMAIKYGIA